MSLLPHTTILVATLLFVALCVASDVRTLRIPNLLTGPTMLLGLSLNAWQSGWSGLQTSITGCVAAMILLFAPFALGGVGAGDVKMMGAVGALLGPNLVLESLLFGLALGGVFAIVQLARRRRLREKLAATGRMLTNAILAGSIEPLKLSSTSPNAVALPYSLPLGLGTAGVIALTVVGKTTGA